MERYDNEELTRPEIGRVMEELRYDRRLGFMERDHHVPRADGVPDDRRRDHRDLQDALRVSYEEAAILAAIVRALTS